MKTNKKINNNNNKLMVIFRLPGHQLVLKTGE